MGVGCSGVGGLKGVRDWAQWGGVKRFREGWVGDLVPGKLFEEGDNSLETYLELLADLQGKVHVRPEETLDELKDEYTYLMIGPGQMPAPPWESVYLSDEPVLFQENTLKVRKAYLKYDFLPANYPREADDHLALELDFMANLSFKTENLFKGRKLPEVKKLLTDQKNFLDEHLGFWIGKFAEKIQNSKTHYFYPQMALLTEHLFTIDRKLIDELLTVL